MFPRALTGEFRVLKELASHKPFDVFHVKEKNTDQDRVIRLLPIHLAGDSGLSSRFHEFFTKCTEIVNKTNIATVYSVNTRGRHIYAIEEFVSGIPLIDYCSKGLPSTEGKEPIIKVLEGICEGLHYAHQNGVFHLCITPHDILVDEAGSGRVKLVGFGMQIFGSGTSVDHLSDQCRKYLAPEILRSMNFEPSPSSDLYSLAFTIREVCPEITDFHRILSAALSAQSQDRYQRARDFRKDLRSGSTEPESHFLLFTEPSGATVRINGSERGKTTSSGLNIPWNEGPITVELNGYETKDLEYSSPPKSSRITLKLKRLEKQEKEKGPGGLKLLLHVVTDPPGASVKVNGELKGETGADGLLVPWATGKMVIEKQDYEPEVRNYSRPPRGQETEIFVKLKSTLVSVVLKTDPTGSRISVDGQYRGETPPSGLRLPLRPGKRRLLIEHKDYIAKDEFFDFRRVDGDQHLAIKLVPKPIPPEEATNLPVPVSPYRGLLVATAAFFGVVIALGAILWWTGMLTPRSALTVLTDPPSGVQVFLRGSLVGSTSDGKLVLPRIPTGKADLQFKKPNYQDQTQTVEVRKDYSNEVRVKLHLAFGDLLLSTDPGGVSVKINGAEKGTTNTDGKLLVKQLPVEMPIHLVLDKGEEFETMQVTLPDLSLLSPLSEGVYVSETFTLQKLLGRLTVILDQPMAEVYINEKLCGKTGPEGKMTCETLPLGMPLTVIARKNCWEPLTVADGLVLNKRNPSLVLPKKSLSPALHEIEFTTDPADVEVKIDGSRAGKTDQNGKLVLPGIRCGKELKVDFEKPGFAVVSRTVSVPGSWDQRQYAVEKTTLSKTPLIINTNPSQAEIFINGTKVGDSDPQGFFELPDSAEPEGNFRIQVKKQCHVAEEVIYKNPSRDRSVSVILKEEKACGPICSKLVEEGKQQVNQGQYLAALKSLNEAVGRCGQTDDILLYIGLAHANLKDTEKAKSHFLSAVKMNPEKHVAWYNLGVLYTKTVASISPMDSAFEEFKKAGEQVALAKANLESLAAAKMDAEKRFRKLLSDKAMMLEEYRSTSTYYSSYYDNPYSTRTRLRDKFQKLEEEETMIRRTLLDIEKNIAAEKTVLKQREADYSRIKNATGAVGPTIEHQHDLARAKVALEKACELNQSPVYLISLLNLYNNYSWLISCRDIEKLSSTYRNLRHSYASSREAETDKKTLKALLSTKNCGVR